ncbi:MAG TPA: hypothetical protein VF618_11135 [Thermoanaerobaculia bacterium]
MKRFTTLVLSVCALALVFAAPSAYACRAYAASDFVRGDIKSSDLNDYAFIYDSAGDPWGCAGAARIKLETKLSNTPATEWQKWLSGGSVTYVMAAGLFIGAFDQLTPSLDAKIRDVAKNYQFDRQRDINGNVTCGFDSFKWQTGNTCLEDYAMDASAQAWIAAYLRHTGRVEWTTHRAKAITAMSNMLDPQTSCIRKFDPNAPKDLMNRGVCNGTYADLIAVPPTGELVTLNHGQQSLAYGIGQMTSFGSAVVGLDVAERSFAKTELLADRLGMIGYLFAEASSRSAATGTNSAEFSNNGCYLLDAGNFALIPGYPCYDTQFYAGNHPSTLGTPTPYRADNFKMKQLYDRFAFSRGGATGYMFDRFNDIFLTGPNDWDKTWGLGRKHFYFSIGSYYAGAGPSVRPSMEGMETYPGGIKRGSYWTTAGNGATVTLSGTSRTAGSLANMTLVDGNGGSLRHGDTVLVKNVNGQHWLATNGGGSTIVTTAGSGTIFTIHKVTQTAELIAAGDQFYLRAPSGHYLTAPTFGGNVTATSATMGTNERFTLDRTLND